MYSVYVSGFLEGLEILYVQCSTMQTLNKRYLFLLFLVIISYFGIHIIGGESVIEFTVGIYVRFTLFVIRGTLLINSKIFHLFRKICQLQKLDTITVGNKKILKFCCEDERWVMQSEPWLEFWNLGLMVLCCESQFFFPQHCFKI